ncbi:methylaspartate mutase subunit E [Halanaerobium sp. MA284_MarDTE_T2]|uniref:methylaspartate mutase subunit E n=1 Tax=Halanaerobium sp. MA284_MarDTE_T2 TaxID=2183913 RepID=UPI000E178557|nr:methylaspartate mutase subunit E [Halanaerobium sp. MA284_MarDTE_T2]RCW41832.1 glutamate mutase subunit E [Halanaerobium sp. MA284_MarDTE_T2]
MPQLFKGKIEKKEFMEKRKEILKSWKTGSEVDLRSAVEFQRSLSEGRRTSSVLKQAASEGKILCQPRAGLTLLDHHLELLNFLKKNAKADILSTNVDTMTRQNRYQDAENGLVESREIKKSLLDGFPIVSHGVDNCREIILNLDIPVQLRHGTPDSRLMAEIAYASGFNDFVGGGISYNFPYAKDKNPADTVSWWQYVDRLTGYYEDRGVNINRETFGPLTGTMVPPAISVAVSIIEGILAAEQGVIHLSLGYGQNGNLIQDTAALMALREMADKYINDDLNLTDDIFISTVFHEWLGGFPEDRAAGFALINTGILSAAAAETDKIVVRSPGEAINTSCREDLADGIRTTKHCLKIAKRQDCFDMKLVEEEKSIIIKEASAIIDRVKDIADGFWAKGAVKAVDMGIIDVPFSSSTFNRGEVMPCRDSRGAVRFFNTGRLPFNDEIKEFHREKIEERADKEKREVDFQMVIDDIYAAGRGLLSSSDFQN